MGLGSRVPKVMSKGSDSSRLLHGDTEIHGVEIQGRCWLSGVLPPKDFLKLPVLGTGLTADYSHWSARRLS